MVSAAPSSSAAAPLSLVTWSRGAQLALLLQGESAPAQLPHCSGCCDPSPMDRRGTLAITSYSTGSSHCTGRLAVGITYAGKRKRSYDKTWRLWWTGKSNLFQCWLKVGAKWGYRMWMYGQPLLLSHEKSQSKFFMNYSDLNYALFWWQKVWWELCSGFVTG